MKERSKEREEIELDKLEIEANRSLEKRTRASLISIASEKKEGKPRRKKIVFAI